MIQYRKRSETVVNVISLLHMMYLRILQQYIYKLCAYNPEFKYQTR